MNLNEIQHKIFNIKTESEFNECALAIFNYQYQNCKVYNQYCNLTKTDLQKVQSIEQIPFLPIQFFKSQEVKSGLFSEAITFTSSGTTGSSTSKHFVKDLYLYEKSFLTAFEAAYPNWKDTTIIGLLPSYLERKGSSLIYMVDYLIKNSNSNQSQFQLNVSAELIEFLENDESPKILFGVTFALLELADKGITPKNTIIIETGGMKGRGKELTRDELHSILNSKIQPTNIHSEYGMTELLSQAYLKNEFFECPNWMKSLVRETTDPFNTKLKGKGALNIIDLANIHSCSFIATEDLGKVNSEGQFKVSGRMDHSQVRGCNLLVV